MSRAFKKWFEKSKVSKNYQYWFDGILKTDETALLQCQKDCRRAWIAGRRHERIMKELNE